MIILIKNQKIKLNPNDLPIMVYHKDKVYYIKYSSKKCGLYMNKEQNKET